MRSRRSCLSVPGSSPKMLAKAGSLPADAVILDLEDAVVPGAKDEARSAVARAIRGGDWAGKAVSVRINGTDTVYCYRDVIEMAQEAGSSLDCLVIPKVESAADVQFVDRLLGMVEQASGRARRIGLELLIETASGLESLREIARASTRTQALILGPADLRASLGLEQAAGAASTEDYPGDPWHWARGAILVAARAAGLQAIHGPYLKITDVEGTARAARQARALGYDGMWALHPGQIGPLNDAFTPNQAEFDRATAMLEAYAHATEVEGRGAVRFGAEMIDEASRKQAVQCAARGRAAGLHPQKTWTDFKRDWEG